MAKKADDAPVTRAYAGGDSNVAKEAHDRSENFKRGGRAKKNVGKVDGPDAMRNAGRKARASGGRLLSSASGGTPRKAAEHY